MWPFKRKDKGVTATKRNWIKISIAIALFIPGCALAIFGNNADNAMLIVIGFAFLVGAVFLFRAGWSTGGGRVIKPDSETEEITEPPNCFNIYADRTAFEYIENTEGFGLQRKYHNDGKYYYLNIVEKLDSKKLIELRLPDDDESQRHYPPAEFANVITMPANKKYYSWAPALFQKIGIGVMGIIIAGEIIGSIVVGG